jgi:drug/metabolite transporter (DMT)-like permease
VVIVVAGDHGLGSIDAHGLLILLAALSWSLYFALQKHHTGRYDGLTLVCYTVWSGTLLLLVFLPGLVEQVALRAARAAGGACPGDIPQCLGVSGLGLCAGTCGFESGDDDAVSGTADGNGHCVVCAGERPTLMVGVGAVVVLISVLALNLERRPRVQAARA